ncbi:MAG TPA: hypothetical protein VGD60_05360 [Candidatus Acidoferrales bacterium]
MNNPPDEKWSFEPTVVDCVLGAMTRPDPAGGPDLINEFVWVDAGEICGLVRAARTVVETAAKIGAAPECGRALVVLGEKLKPFGLIPDSETET